MEEYSKEELIKIIHKNNLYFAKTIVDLNNQIEKLEIANFNLKQINAGLIRQLNIYKSKSTRR